MWDVTRSPIARTSQPHAQPDDRLGGGGNDGRQDPGPERVLAKVMSRFVVVLLFLRDDRRDGRGRRRILAFQSGELMLEMPEHDALDGDGGGGDRIRTEQAGDGAEHEAARAAEPVAAAAALPAARKLGAEYRPVALLMRPEFHEFADEMRRGELGHHDLAGVDADGAVFAGMVDLEDPIAEIVAGGVRGCVHDASSLSRSASRSGWRKLDPAAAPGIRVRRFRPYRRQ